MTASALTRPGERDRLIVKLANVDWTFCLVLCLIAVAGGLMMFSIAGSSFEPWALNHVTRFGMCFVLMVVLAMMSPRVWFAAAYPVYFAALLLLGAVDLVRDLAG